MKELIEKLYQINEITAELKSAIIKQILRK